MVRLNGKYLNDYVNLKDSCYCIASIFVNCSNRCIYLSSSSKKLNVEQCFFVNCCCSSGELDNGRGGCIFASCHRSLIKSSRAFHVYTLKDGIMAYVKADISRQYMISINDIIYQTPEHYVLVDKKIDNINVTNGAIEYDIGVVHSETELIRYILYCGLSSRTLFRFNGTYEYGNIINCSCTSIFYYHNGNFNHYFFYNNSMSSLIFDSSGTSKLTLKNCVLIKTSFNSDSNVYTENMKNDGISYNCMIDIPLICETKNKKYQGHISLLFYISSLIF